jgi:hypothetical protein
MGTFFKMLRFALQRSAADFEIRSAARFSAAGVLALQRCSAVLKNMSAAAQHSSSSSKIQALQRSAAAAQKCAAKTD